MSDFITLDFKVGMFLRYGKTKVEIVRIKQPYAIIKLPSISASLGKYPERKINLLAYKESDVIDVESLQTEESLERAELEDLLN